MSKLIPLTQGYSCIVDDADYEWLSGFKWQYANGYAARGVFEGGRSIKVYMHRLILGITGRSQGDHANRNRLDNRRSNLRASNASQNRANAKVKMDSSTGFKGVRRRKETRYKTRNPKWDARITVGCDRKFLGSFLSPEEAARAYDAAALEHFGPFAATNKTLGLLT